MLSLSKENDQVFINTHSSVFIADNEPIQTIFKVDKNEGITHIDKTDDVDKPNLIYELLGGSPGDLYCQETFL